MTEKALRYNEGKPQWSLIDFDSLEPMVRVLEYWMKKYTVWDVTWRDNWKKPMDRKKILDSMMRHQIALMAGEEIDQESGKPHIGHIMANAMFYSYHSNKYAKKKYKKYY